MILFEYEKTELKDGFYVVQVTEHGETELVVAEWTEGFGWAQTGIDFDVWRYRNEEPVLINVVARVHLDKGVASMEIL